MGYQTEDRFISQRYMAAQTIWGRFRLTAKMRLNQGRWIWEVAGGRFLKRALDLVASTALLIGLSPLFAVIAVLIKWEDGGPVFFLQLRVGKDGRRFHIWKFRSMCQDAEARLKELIARNHLGRSEFTTATKTGVVRQR